MSNRAPNPSTFELRWLALAARDLPVLAFRGREVHLARLHRVDIDVAVPFADPAAFEPQILERPMHLALQARRSARVLSWRLHPRGVERARRWPERVPAPPRLAPVAARQAPRGTASSRTGASTRSSTSSWRNKHPRRFARVRAPLQAAPGRASQYRETDRDFVTAPPRGGRALLLLRARPQRGRRADGDRRRREHLSADPRRPAASFTGARRQRTAPSRPARITSSGSSRRALGPARTAAVVPRLRLRASAVPPLLVGEDGAVDGGAEDGRY